MATNKYVDEIMKGVRKLQKGELLLQEDDLEWIVEKQIRKAQLDVLEEILVKPHSITAYNWEGYVHNSVIQSKINQLKEQTND